ncbi:MAG TPA: hypothetical protein VMS86_11385, partial [Thermoanaerobaculia bacterium]|nr:hypothetical protein [Thermoanaerobaculia bacterium]
MVESSGRGSLQHVKQCASAPGLSARLLRRETQFLLDVAALSLAFVVAYLLRFDLQIPERYLRLVVLQLPLVVLLQFLTLAGAGVYSLIWRFVGIADLPRFARAALWAALPLLLLRWLPGPFDAWRIPLSVILLDLGLAYGGVLGLRVLRRSVYETSERERRKGKTEDQETRRVLLVGAGRAGVLAIREMHGRRDLGLEPVGFVDDDPLKQGMMVDGVEVLGDTEDIPRLASELGIDHVILSIVDAPRPTLARIVATCERGGVAVRTVPGIYEILTGRVAIS